MHSRPLGPGLLIFTIGAKRLQILGWMQNISIFEIMQLVTKMVWKQKEYFALPFKQIKFSLIVSSNQPIFQFFSFIPVYLQTNPSFIPVYLQTSPFFSSFPSFLSTFKQPILQFSSFIPVYLQTNPSFSSFPSFLSTFKPTHPLVLFLHSCLPSNQPILQFFSFIPIYLQTNPSFSSFPLFLSTFKPIHSSVLFLYSCLPSNQSILQFSSFIPVYLQTNPSFSSLASFLSTFNQLILLYFNCFYF